MKSPEPSAEPLSAMRAGLRSVVIRRGARIRESDGAAVLALMCAGACAPILAERSQVEALPEIRDKGGPLLEKASRKALFRLRERLGEDAELTSAEIEEAFAEQFAEALAAKAGVPEQITDEAAALLLKFDGLQGAMDAAVSRGNSALARSIVDQLIIFGARSEGARRLISHTLLADSLGFVRPDDPSDATGDDVPAEESDEVEPPEPKSAARDDTESVRPPPPPEDTKGLKRWLRSRRVVTGVLIALATCLIVTSVLTVAAHLRLESYRTEIVTERLLEASAEALPTDGPLAQLLAAAAWRLDPTDEAWAAMSRAMDSPATGQFTSSQDLDFGTVAYNPDGTSFATLGGDGSVELWDTETWKHEPLEDEDESAFSGPLAFSPDGLTLAAGSYDEPVRLWDLRTRDFTELEVGHDVTLLVFDPLGTKLAAVGAASSDWFDLDAEITTAVTIWDLETSEQISSFGAESSPTGAAFDPEGEELLLATDQDAYLRGFDAATGDQTSELDFSDGSGGSIGAFDISPRVPHDYLVCMASCLVWRQSADGTPSPIVATDASYEHAEFSPKGDRVLSAVFEEGIGVWDAATGARVGMLPFTGLVDDVAVSPDGRTAVTLSEGSLQRWDLDRLAERREIRPTLYPPNITMASGWSLAINTSTEGTETFEGRYGAAPVETYPERIGLGSALSPDSSIAATVLDGSPSAIELWDLESGETINTISDDSDGVTTLGFSHDGSMLYAATVGFDDQAPTGYQEENDVVVWDLDTGDELTRLTLGGAWPAESIDISPDGSTLLTISGDGGTRLWDIADGSLIDEIGGVDSQPFDAGFSPDGGLIAAATSDGIALWDTADLSAEPTVFDTGFSSSSVGFSPDGDYLAVNESFTTDYEDERPPRVTILDLNRGEVAAELPITTLYSTHSGVGISPDGDSLAFVESDGITVADISYLRGDVYKLTCEQAGRDLTEDEWREYLPEFEYRSLDFCG